MRMAPEIQKRLRLQSNLHRPTQTGSIVFFNVPLEKEFPIEQCQKTGYFFYKLNLNNDIMNYWKESNGEACYHSLVFITSQFLSYTG